MTIEKRPSATADKNAPTQAPVPVAPPAVPGPGPKLPGAPGVPGTERFRLLAYVRQESMVRVDKRPDETVLTWPHLLRAEFLMACRKAGLAASKVQATCPCRRALHRKNADGETPPFVDVQRILCARSRCIRRAALTSPQSSPPGECAV